MVLPLASTDYCTDSTRRRVNQGRVCGRRAAPALLPRDGDLQVFAWHHQRVRAADVAAFEQGADVPGEAGLPFGVGRRIRLAGRPVEIA